MGFSAMRGVYQPTREAATVLRLLVPDASRRSPARRLLAAWCAADPESIDAGMGPGSAAHR
ncbi:protein of unknown function [Bradyrhizobium vignae]|uniref:Uncharacterized protein n=1 Tax=Bradyrhizobium vignae TaxID=1549949 RepID=A0A2U3PT45_9BRAD|nr:protein of unknown function [Bradyrhizobium vignae]